MDFAKSCKLLEYDPWLEPYKGDLELRMRRYGEVRAKVAGDQPLSDFANGANYYGFHYSWGGWYYREWAPGADSLALIGDFNDWDPSAHVMERKENGNFEIFIKGKKSLPHGSRVKVRVTSGGRTFDRIPLYIHRVVQDEVTKDYSGQVWFPKDPYAWKTEGFQRNTNQAPVIYEAHIGMATEEERIGSYREFTENVLPRIKKGGYNTIQLMAIMEHPYYASFGYQVTNFFAASSRYGTPEELKELIDAAHGMGVAVLLDLIHSHASGNALEGITDFDGTDYQFCHTGPQGSHPAWGTKLFNYGKPEVIHFLLSNLKYWLEEYRFDGFRFDGVTSMLYHHHGLGTAFDHYGKYFSMDTDLEAVTYLQLASELIHEIRPDAVAVAEDMSGMPGMCIPVQEGGIGFDYRLSMGVPDFWIRTLKTLPDEQWSVQRMWDEMTGRRPMEKNIGYCESHDQALVGDKTLIFWLADKEMYWHMNKDDSNLVIDRAVAYHKMIRLVTSTLAGEGYLNFMGNEFGHPEWVDFPREGNGWSYKYARRLWSLADNDLLKYQYLLEFDQALMNLLDRVNILQNRTAQCMELDDSRKTMVYKKGKYTLLFNFHPTNTWEVHAGVEGESCKIALATNDRQFGGWQSLKAGVPLEVLPGDLGRWIKADLPPRTALVIE